MESFINMKKSNILKKLYKLKDRLERYGTSRVYYMIRQPKRLAFKDDVRYVDHAIRLMEGDHVMDFSKVDMMKLNVVWKKYCNN